jgi:hypothetical protein
VLFDLLQEECAARAFTYEATLQVRKRHYHRVDVAAMNRIAQFSACGLLHFATLCITVATWLITAATLLITTAASQIDRPAMRRYFFLLDALG